VRLRHRRSPPRPHDLLLDGLALLISEGHAAGAPTLRQAVSAFCGADTGEDELRWLWLAWYAASIVWDYKSWDVLSARHVRLARDAGALTTLPIAFNTRAGVHLLAGRFTEADSMNAEAESVTEILGSSIAPYGALSLAAFRGREAEASHLAETTIKDVERRGEGEALSFVHWATAVLCNGLGRYDHALAAAQLASSYPPSLWFGNWALAELIEAAARSGRPQRAATTTATLRKPRHPPAPCCRPRRTSGYRRSRPLTTRTRSLSPPTPSGRRG
jgi:hypothetical protein